ncbi:Oidioi.mRNA.OKI2018_I69.PAR.g8699.t1.cds [Oikopleura dioica]|uniref:thioredoxin-dependent peroxiredoxin n=1 Tax=Oikopleura dioica TaxID=34765 RepID=A0ABN7RIB8_OIKDI|nr:Oidioi.mRNA.OKI2018_I69.PAR.g8699.t1.cds [Oikopleura dioica]
MSVEGKAEIGEKAPTWTCKAVVDEEFVDISSSDYKDKWLILFFYPLDFTFVCPTEIIAFSEAAKSFREINCEVVAASCDSQFTHLAWMNQPKKEGGLGEVDIPIIADTNHALSKAFGVLKKDEGIPYRGLFIIDNNDVIRQITINDLPVGRSVDEVKRLVKAFQFVDKFGEVCPENWQPDAKTIVPTVEGSKKYFEEVNN